MIILVAHADCHPSGGVKGAVPPIRRKSGGRWDGGGGPPGNRIPWLLQDEAPPGLASHSSTTPPFFVLYWALALVGVVVLLFPTNGSAPVLHETYRTAVGRVPLPDKYRLALRGHTLPESLRGRRRPQGPMLHVSTVLSALSSVGSAAGLCGFRTSRRVWVLWRMAQRLVPCCAGELPYCPRQGASPERVPLHP